MGKTKRAEHNRSFERPGRRSDDGGVILSLSSVLRSPYLFSLFSFENFSKGIKVRKKMWAIENIET